MTNAVSENGLKVLNYVIENPGKTAQEIADALGFEKKASVDAIVTSGLIGTKEPRRNLVERIVSGIGTNEKGKPVEIKVINPTQAGLDYDHESALQADAEAKAAELAAKAAAKAAKAE